MAVSISCQASWGNDLGLRAGKSDSAGGGAVNTILVEGKVVPATVDTAGCRGRAAINNRLKVATARAGWVGPGVVSTGQID